MVVNFASFSVADVQDVLLEGVHEVIRVAEVEVFAKIHHVEELPVPTLGCRTRHSGLIGRIWNHDHLTLRYTINTMAADLPYFLSSSNHNHVIRPQESNKPCTSDSSITSERHTHKQWEK